LPVLPYHSWLRSFFLDISILGLRNWPRRYQKILKKD